MINEVSAEQLVCVVEERSTIPFTYNKKIESNLRNRHEADGEIKLNVLEKPEPHFLLAPQRNVHAPQL